MNLHQFRFVQEAVRRNLNLTETAKALYTSQPGISKAILELEEELGVDIFARHGKRLRASPSPGQQVLKSVEIIMREVANLKRIGEEFAKQDAGTLSIATTHTQARYFLPEPVAALRKRYPEGRGRPAPGHARAGGAHAAGRHGRDRPGHRVAGRTTTSLVTLPCYEWQHVVVVPAGHPLAGVERPTLEQLAREPLVTYHPTFTGRTRIDQAFARARMQPDGGARGDRLRRHQDLRAPGPGRRHRRRDGGARRPGPSGDLVSRPAGHLFGTQRHARGLQARRLPAQFVFTFAELLSDRLAADRPCACGPEATASTTNSEPSP